MTTERCRVVGRQTVTVPTATIPLSCEDTAGHHGPHTATFSARVTWWSDEDDDMLGRHGDEEDDREGKATSATGT